MPEAQPKAAVILLNFGEPETSNLEEVVPFLERIFMANARLEPGTDPDRVRARSRELAQRRAPGLARAYETIGGSPLARQAEEQRAALAGALAARGQPMPVEVGMQFTRPTIAEAVEALRAEDPEVVVALPIYPLCGPSTTVAALESVSQALAGARWSPDVREISGWHRHPGYTRFRADAVRRGAAAAGLDLVDPAVRLVFSAHGTPLRYVREGSRYVAYVEDWCERQACALGVDRWTLGYQNHTNRAIEWTQPAVEDALAALEGVAAVLVDPISFMHEQSETLMELDVDLAGQARDLGLRFHRVPIAHAAPDFIEALTDLVLSALDTDVAGLPPRTACRCRPGAELCFNGGPAA